ncbi:hypothetical protein [Brasilonema sp. UFV-L1]|uniref:hypothetical protein n=1 Tax=Brasilonema sp. UFV-L1 TaxID=2234130 RepID=UPI00145DC342|nr:hypothetical protein [Brasilonema sp. UFV-L1]NMG09727.1 hypothetical protein [Brasilonema sp. UFV-L1]
MNIGFFSRIPYLSLMLLWLAYTLLGWYLSAHHIAWLVGIFIAVVALFVASKSSSLFERSFRFCSQGLFVVLMTSLAISTLVALAATWSILLTLLVIPLATTILAELEMRFTGLSKVDTFVVLTVLAGFGLIVGEMIDILLFPSIRY